VVVGSDKNSLVLYPPLILNHLDGGDLVVEQALPDSRGVRVWDRAVRPRQASSDADISISSMK
jgi:hypothetical protein